MCEAKRILEEQLSEIVLNVPEMEEAIISLEKAVKAKQGHVSCATSSVSRGQH